MAEKKVNRARLTALFISSCLLFCVAGGFYLYRLHRIHAHFATIRAQGLAAADAGQSTAATDLLGEYLARYPSDPAVLAAYARNVRLVELPNNEHLARAIWALRHLLRIDPNRLDARQQIMQLYIQTNYHAEALDAANTILTARLGGDSNPTSHLQLTALGVDPAPIDHPLSDADIASIRTPLLTAIHNFPDALEAVSVRAKSLLQLHEFPQALNACNWWIESDPSDLDAALTRVELLQDNHRSQEEAMSLANQWISRHTNAGENDLLKGHTSLAYGSVPDAIVALTSAAKSNPTSLMAVRRLIADLDAIHQSELARTVLIRLLASRPNDNAIRYDLISRDWDAGNLAQVVSLSANLQTASLTPTYILGLRASALMLLLKTDETTLALKALTDRKDDREAAAWVILIRQSIDRHSDLMQILNACTPALEQNPRDYYIRHFMAEAYAQLGEPDLAIHEWQRVVTENRSWALPALRLSKLLLDAGRTEQALQAAADAQSRAPHSVDAAFALAQAWTANIQAGHKDDANKCMDLVNLLEHNFPHDGRSSVLKSTLLASLDQPSQAAQVVQDALAAPDTLPEQSWIRLASLSETKHLISADHKHLELACLARSQKEHGITPALAYAKAVATADPKAGLLSFDADAASAAKLPAATQASLTEVSSTGTNNDGGANLVLSWDLARAAYLELIHDPQASAAWQKLADSNVSVLRVQRLVLSVQSVRADQALSARCIDRIGQLSGHQDSSWRSARARWLVEFAPFFDSNKHPTPEADEARNLLNDLVTQMPDSVETRLVSAMAYERAGKLQDAINEVRFASNISPEVVSIRLQLARLLETEGDFDAVQEQLDHLTDADLLVTDQRRQAAAIFAQQGQMDRAIKLLEEDSRTDKEADTAALLLAELYQRHGDLPKSEAVVQKLLAGKPDSAALRFAADLFASKGDMAQAHAALDRLGKDGKTEPGVEQLIRADFMLRHEPQDGPDKIISMFESATKAAPANPLAWRALTAANLLFNRPDRALTAVNDGLRANPGDPTLAAISRQPAMLRFAAADPQLQPLLLYFVNDPSVGSAAASTLSAIYADSLSKPSQDASSNQPRDALSDQLQELAAQYPRFAPLQVYLINRFQTRFRFDDAIAVASVAGRANPDSAPIAEATTALMLNAKRYPEALAAAQRWYDHVPAQRTNAILAQAEALLKLSRSAEAVNLLKPLVDSYAAAPDSILLENYSQISQKYVEAQTAAGIKPDLAALMQPLLSRGAQGRLQWMQFAVTNMPPAEAEAWLQRANTQMPDVSTPAGVIEHVVLSEMYSRLGNKFGDPRYAQTARQMLLTMAKADKPQAAVLLALGTRLDADSDWPQAVASYQRALVIQPDNLVAQNNLAMDLARNGHAAEGLPYIESALKARPDAAELYDTRAFVRSKAGDLKSAITDMRSAIHLSPNQPRYHFELVQMLVDSNLPKAAVDELKVLDSMSTLLSPDQAQQLKDLHARISVASAGGTN